MWRAFENTAAGRPPRLQMAALDPGADFSYDAQDLDFERIGAGPG